MIPLLTWPAAGIAASRRSSATLAPAEYTGWNRRARAAEPISARDGCEPRKDLRKLSKSKLRVAAHYLGQRRAGFHPIIEAATKTKHANAGRLRKRLGKGPIFQGNKATILFRIKHLT